MKKLIKRSYKSIVKRGKINDRTRLNDFVKKINEENREMNLAFENGVFIEDITDQFWLEMMDLVNACFCCMEHHEIDIVKLFKLIIQKNENRND